ncbi:MAG: hypothetical protein U0165_14490 [Polyangiaceae bacterium]
MTPDKYVFDFVTVVVPAGVTATLDGVVVDASWCDAAAADGLDATSRKGAADPGTVFRCQLSFGVVTRIFSLRAALSPDCSKMAFTPSVASAPVGVLVSGFDSFVSYGCAAGTDLKIVIF